MLLNSDSEPEEVDYYDLPVANRVKPPKVKALPVIRVRNFNEVPSVQSQNL